MQPALSICKKCPRYFSTVPLEHESVLIHRCGLSMDLVSKELDWSLESTNKFTNGFSKIATTRGGKTFCNAAFIFPNDDCPFKLEHIMADQT